MNEIRELTPKDRISVTLADAVVLTGIGRRTLENLARSDIKFPSFKVGSKTLIHVDALNKYLAEKAKARVGVGAMSKRVAGIMARREASAL